ncbi:MAG: GspE/PulE family protein [bacterium]|nr:GspE/PulE family protein [bacterium]
MDQSKKSLVKEKLEQLRAEAEERDAQRRADKTGHSCADLITSPINVEAIALIPEETARRAKLAAFEIKEKKVALAVFDPTKEQAKKAIEELKQKGYEPLIFIVSPKSLNHVLSFYRFVSEQKEQITGKVRIEEKKFSELKNILISLESIKISIQPLNTETIHASQVLEIILAGALANRASDIHFEPGERIVKLRLRIDGLLHDVFNELKKDIYEHLITKIKILSGLKINIHDETQDGRFTINLPEKNVEVRVAIAPSEFGEVAVMRLLDPDAIDLSLSDLGIREDDLEIIKTELKRPNGMILNTGPTGSGKTTTLYAFLKHKKSSEIKIITIEDPIEYHLEGIEQTQVDEEAGYSFENGLRSLMRQDPDAILVGEMRDKETAEIGIQAALTGHIVFSTLHTNNASGAIPRLLDLGVKSTSIGPALNLIIAQRLVRQLCQNCKVLQETGDDLKDKIQKFLDNLPERVSRNNFKEIKIFKPVGCEKCNGTGYKGRIGIYEFFLNDQGHSVLSSHKTLEELINQQAGEGAFREFALEQGMVTMQQDGILKTISGITTLEEVEGITGPIIFLK